MTRRAVTFWAAAATFSLSVAPALAQQSKERPDSKPATGSAVSRPSGGSGGSSPSGGSSGGSSTSSGSSSSGGGSAASMPSGGGSRDRADDGVRRSAPERRNERVASRDDQSRSRTGSRTSGTAATPGDSSGDQRRAVPVYSRPRDGRTTVGNAVRGARPPAGGNGNVIFYPYYDPFYGYGYGYGSRYGYSGYYGPWFAGYGFGLGYFYDPFGYSYYSPYDQGYGYGQYGYGRSRYDRYGRTGPVGQLRLKVKPSEGQVYVDGYYVGEVDSFDGLLQRLAIEAGAHRIEIRAPGYETVAFDVMVAPGETVTYKGEMKRIR